MTELKAALFFDVDNLFAQTNRLTLELPVMEDLPKYIDAIGENMPGLANWYRRSEEARLSYWEAVNAETSLYCSIRLRGSREFCGYCSIDDLCSEPFEIGINLLSEHQDKGYGSEAIAALLAMFEKVAGPTNFIARIEAENTRSQRVFRKLGFAPEGISTFLIKDPAMLEKFEEERLDAIDDNILSLAEEFGVEPRKLLSHLLVFARRAGSRESKVTHEVDQRRAG